MKNNKILAEIENIFDEVIQYRRTIHANPELSFEEYETSKFIQDKLKENNIDFDVYDTAVIAHIGSGDRCIALRADIDALPITEETGLPFKSRKSGVMHACGHDMHTSMLLAAAKIIKKNESLLTGKIKFIFQPGEEKIPGGASILLEKGALNNPEPEAVFGQHINPGDTVGKVAMAAGPVMASADELYFTVKGKGSHAAQPHLGSDAVLASANIIQYLQSIITKFRNPINPGVISITSIHGGSAPNIFPDEVKLMGTMRAFDNDWRLEIHNYLNENLPKIAELYNCEIEIEIRKGYPPLINSQLTTNIANNIAVELFGKDNAIEFEPKMWAEDFAYFAQKYPSTFWFIGVKPVDLDTMPPLHNAKLNPVEDAMKNGIAMFVKIAFDYFNK